MYGNESIMINPVSNGWIVQIPSTPVNPHIDQVKEILPQFRDMIKEIKGMSNDPILQKVFDEQNENELINQAESILSNKTDISLFRNNGFYIFKTFPEVIAFLSEKFGHLK